MVEMRGSTVIYGHTTKAAHQVSTHTQPPLRLTDLDGGVLHKHVRARLRSRVNGGTAHRRSVWDARAQRRGVNDDRTLATALGHGRNLDHAWHSAGGGGGGRGG